MVRLSVIVMIAGLVLGGCSTVAGVGKDISAVGKGVTHVADEVREEVFGSPTSRTVQTRYTATGSPTVIVSQPCDASPELAGGNHLPPCPRTVYRR